MRGQKWERDCPGRPVVNISPSKARGVGSIPGWGAKILYASWPKKQKHKTEAILLTNSIKTLKMVHIPQKKISKQSWEKKAHSCYCMNI